MSLVGVPIPKSRIITVPPRGQGFADVSSAKLAPGESLVYALEFRGTNLPSGSELSDMDEPAPSGDDSNLLTVSDYSVDDTQARFRITLDGAATADSDIAVECSVDIASDETMLITVPVTVKAAG